MWESEREIEIELIDGWRQKDRERE